MGVLCSSLFWYALLYILSCFAIILAMKRELFALLLLSFGCLDTVDVLWFFLTVPWVGLQFVIVAFPDHTYFLYLMLDTDSIKNCEKIFIHFCATVKITKLSLRGHGWIQRGDRGPDPLIN